MKITTCLIRLLLLMILPLALTETSTPARADVAPPPPPAGANLFPGVETTQVRMMSETVVISVAGTEPGEAPYARVRAQFKMRNLGQDEEILQVRFPLNFLPDYMGNWQSCEYPLEYPEIGDFSALIDEKAITVTTKTQKITDPGGTGGSVDVKCWAEFPVTFPVGKDVGIEVRYTVLGAPGLYGMHNNIQFYYLLASGAAWKDTIGSAEIILTTPYILSEKNLLGYQPESGVVSGSEIRWRFENIEPQSNITAGLLDPGHWKLINQQVKAVSDNPQDGVAWAKLARAYRDAVIAEPSGFHGQLAGYEYYAQSLTAFNKAVNLRPDDVDLRIDYADLLIRNAFSPIAGDAEDIHDSLVLAVKQLQRALEIHPNHPRAIELLQSLESWENAPQKIVDLSGARPNYLILTPGGPTRTAAPTQTRTPFPPSLTPTPTWTRNPTRTLTITPTPSATVPFKTFTPLALAEVDQESTPPQPENPRAPQSPLCGAALLPFVALTMVKIWGQGISSKKPGK